MSTRKSAGIVTVTRARVADVSLTERTIGVAYCVFTPTEITSSAAGAPGMNDWEG